MTRGLVRRGTALLLSWVFTATSVWAVAPPAVAVRPAGAAIPLPRLVPSLGADALAGGGEVSPPAAADPSWMSGLDPAPAMAAAMPFPEPLAPAPLTTSGGGSSSRARVRCWSAWSRRGAGSTGRTSATRTKTTRR